MTKIPISLSGAGLFLKIMAWCIIIIALGQIKHQNDAGFVLFLELFGIGLFWVAGRLQGLQEWARLTCWGLCLLAGAYFILDYALAAFVPFHQVRPAHMELGLGVCFIWLFVYLNQPTVKYLFQRKTHGK